VRALRVRFTETVRPTLNRDAQGASLCRRAALLWLGLEGGVLVQSDVDLEVPVLGPSGSACTTGCNRARGLAADRDARGVRALGRASHLEAVAKYSDYRKAQVEVQELLPVP